MFQFTNYKSAPNEDATNQRRGLMTAKMVQRLEAFDGEAKAFAHTLVQNNASFSVPNNADTIVTFNTVLQQEGATMRLGGNTARLYPPAAGVYSVGFSFDWAGVAAGTRRCWLRVNGGAIIARAFDVGDAAGPSQAVATNFYFALGDYIEVVAYQNSGGALNINFGGNFSPAFWLTYIGKKV